MIQKIGNTVEDHISRCRRSPNTMRLTKPVLEHVHGEGGWLFGSSFLVPPRVSGEFFAVMVGGKSSIVPRFMGASNAAGSRGRVQNSEEVIKRIDFTLLEGLVRGMGGSLRWWGGKLDGHTSAGDDSRRSCLRSSGGRDKIPRTGDSAGGVRRGLGRDGGGGESDGRHFEDSER